MGRLGTLQDKVLLCNAITSRHMKETKKVGFEEQKQTRFRGNVFCDSMCEL